MSAVILLGDVAERTDRRKVVYRKSDRMGVLSVARLLREHGAGMELPELRSILAGDCERMKAGNFHDPCGCHFPDLPRLF